MEKKSVSRRSFLTSSAATASAFQIIRPELVRGQGNAKLRAGLDSDGEPPSRVQGVTLTSQGVLTARKTRI